MLTHETTSNHPTPSRERPPVKFTYGKKRQSETSPLLPASDQSDATSAWIPLKRCNTDDTISATTRISPPPCLKRSENDEKRALQNVVTPATAPKQNNQLSVKAFFQPVDRRSIALSKSSTVERMKLPSLDATGSRREGQKGNNVTRLNSQSPPHTSRSRPFGRKKDAPTIPRGKLSTAPHDVAKIEAPSRIKYEQLVLDYGQRGLGATTCKECGMSYNRGQSEDDSLHGRYHDAVVGGIDYPGYKNQILVDSIPSFGGELRILMLTWRGRTRESRKIREILNIVDTELGSVELSEDTLESCKMYIAVNSKRKVIGCAVAIPIKEAYRVLISSNDVELTEGKERADEGTGKTRIRSDEVETSGTTNDLEVGDDPVQVRADDRAAVSCEMEEEFSNDADGSSLYCSKESEPALCGISRIWVSRGARRQNIASRLLEAVCVRFIYGYEIPHSSLAFSQPTVEGRALAERFTQRKDFLVYVET